MADPALLETPPIAPPVGPLADLILVRLLPAAKSRPGPAKLRADLAPLFRQPPSGEQIADAMSALRSDGLVTPGGPHLTPAGRERALAYLGVTELPARCDWRAIRSRFLVAKALGLTHLSAGEFRKVNTPDKLAAILLKRNLGLPVGTPATTGAALTAVACRLLGFPDCHRLEDVVPRVLGRHVGDDCPRTMAELKKSLPLALLNTGGRGLDGLRTVALAGQFDAPAMQPAPPPEEAEPFDLEVFARTVLAAARRSPTGRFGDNKVFISHVWRELADQPQIAPLGAAGFKARLLEANRAGLLRLERCDLAHLEDPRDVAESRTVYLNAEFHFVRTEGA